MHVGRGFVQIQQAGQDFSALLVIVQKRGDSGAIGGIVMGRDRA